MPKTTLLILALILTLVTPTLARPGDRKRSPVKADIKIVKAEKTTSPDFNGELLQYTIQVTNRSERSIKVTNNHFVLKLESGVNKRVARGRFPTKVQLEPGKSVTVERVYFEHDRKDKPIGITFMVGGREAGSVKL